MCGLFGWYGLENSTDKRKQEELFRLLARKAQVRGTDSFGVAFVQGRKTKVHRGLGPVSKWLTRDGRLVRRVARSATVVGHTRAASRGDVTLSNAHAFRVGDWIGSHNGCLHNSQELMLSARHTPRGETDSEEALAWLVSEGLTADSFRRLQGSFALTILKADATELIIVVDSRTPFAIAKVGDGIVWHSLAGALESSLLAVGIEARVEEVRNTCLRFPHGAEEVLLPHSEASSRWPRGVFETKEDPVMIESESRQIELAEVWDE